jgi:hypothetical protein
MRCIAVIGIAAIASLPVLATPARAAIEYPWCAQYSGDVIKEAHIPTH